MRKLVIALVALMILPSLCSAYRTEVIGATTVSFDAADYTCDVGAFFNVTVMVEGVANLYAWQVKVVFDPSIIGCSKAFYPSDHVFAGKSTVPLTPQINNVSGFVLFGCSLQGDAATFSGSGKLCTFTFQGKTNGVSFLNFSEPYGGDTYLLDYDLNAIDAVERNSQVTVGQLPPPGGASLGFDATDYVCNVTQYFNVTVNVANVTDLYGWQVRVYFNPNIIECANAFYPSDNVFVDKTTVPVAPVIDNVSGHVLYGYALLGSIPGFSGSGKLCTFTFLGKNEGVSPLNFSKPYGNDTYLLDPSVELIPVSDIHDSQATIRGVVPPPVVHDVAIVGVWITPVAVLAGEPVYVTVVAANQGTVTETFTVLCYYDMSLIDVVVATLMPGEVEAQNFTWNTASVAEGNYSISGEATVVVGETDVSNNRFVGGYVGVMGVTPPPIVHDVAVTTVRAVPMEVYAGESVTIYVNVTNQGTVAESFSVYVYYTSSDFFTPLHIESLLPGEERTLPLAWDTTFTPEGVYMVWARATILPSETDTVDNIFIDGNVWVKGSVSPPPSAAALMFDAPTYTCNVTYFFSATLFVANVSELYAWQVKVHFDPHIIECVNASYPSDNVFAGKSTVPFIPVIDNVSGFVLFAYCLQGDAATFSGSGKLCTFTFVGKNTGVSSLNFSKPYGADTYLLDFNLDIIPLVGVSEAQVIVGEIAPPPTTHDVAILNVSAAPVEVVAGDMVYTDVTVLNQGTATESFYVFSYYDASTIDKIAATIPPNGTIVLHFVWSTAGVAAGSYRISAEAAVVPGETNVANNKFVDGTVRIKSAPPPSLPAFVSFTPCTLNLKSNGKWITAYLRLSSRCNTARIDTSTIMLNGTIPASRCHIAGRFLTIKFSRSEVIDYILNVQRVKRGQVFLTITGSLRDGTTFKGTGKIRVRMHGDLTCDGRVDVRDVSLMAQKLGEIGCDVNGDGRIDMRDIAASAKTWKTSMFMLAKFGTVIDYDYFDLSEDGRIDVRDVGDVARNFGRDYR